MKTDKNLITDWDKNMMAITFAEVGEHDTARELLREKQSEQRPVVRINAWDRIMMAMTFAEVGEHDSARELLREKQNEQRPETRSKKSEQRPELRA